MEEETKDTKEIKISIVVAIATSILAFVGAICLMLAITEFVEVRYETL